MENLGSRSARQNSGAKRTGFRRLIKRKEGTKMKILILLLSVILSIITLNVPAHSEVLYSTFGAGQSFDNSESSGWLVGLSYNQQIAAPFILSSDAILDSISFAADYDNGPNQLTVDLVDDDAGLPSADPGKVIESFNFTNLSQLPTIYTAKSFRKLLLKGSTQYWVVLKADNNATLVQWNRNSIGVGGFAFWNLRTPWTYYRDKTPAFEIKGGPAVPFEVHIVIKPGSDPNSIISINPRSKGVIPVAILTTEDFDAATVDPGKVLFGKTGTETSAFQYKLEDVDGDGDMDMILHFVTQRTGLACGDTEAILTGKTFNGQVIKGSKSIKTVGCENRRP